MGSCKSTFSKWGELLMPNDYLTTDTELTSVANAIRTKGGTSASLVYPTGFVSAIEAISTGTDVSDTTATASDVRTGKYFYTAAGVKTQGSIVNGSATTPATTITANPSISVSNSGLITATASATQSVTPTVSAGYVSSGTAGTITVSGSNTSQLTTQAAQTIHPSTTDQTIASGKYLTGTQTVKGVLLTNLDAGNIKKDVVVKVGDSTDDDCVTSVTGTYEGGGGGNPTAEENDVIFIDYDGTIRYSYSASEFANLTALPANPTHNGLTAQGWNWTLSDAKTYVAANHILVIGQMYVTNDGKTRLYIYLDNTARNTIPLYWYQSDSDGVSIDWGDGTSAQTFSGSGNKDTTHTYANAGNYTISLTVSSGCTLRLGQSAQSSALFGKTSNEYKCFPNVLKKVELGTNIVSTNNYAFYYCMSLKYITIPQNITSVGNYAFSYCYSLKTVISPNATTSLGEYAFSYDYSLDTVSLSKSITSIGQYQFNNASTLNKISYPNSITTIPNQGLYNCSSVKHITIPNGITTINASAFNNCYGLTSVTIPSSVTEIKGYAFGNCYCVYEYHIRPTTPPTLAATSVFSSIPSNCVMYVPIASLDTYKTASIWSNYASKMVGE